MRQKGFTLIELMIVVVVVAILSSIAVPAYLEQSRKGRRADAVQALGALQLQLEQWRAENPSFATCQGAGACDVSGTDYYGVALNATPTTYTITATPQGAQNGDRCGALSVSAGQAKPSWAGDDDCNM